MYSSETEINQHHSSMSLLLSGQKNPMLLWVIRKFALTLKSCGSFCNIQFLSLHWKTVENSKDNSKLLNHMVFFPSHYIFYLFWDIVMDFFQLSVNETFPRLAKVKTTTSIVFWLLVIVVEQGFCSQKGSDKIHCLLWKRKKKAKKLPQTADTW